MKRLVNPFSIVVTVVLLMLVTGVSLSWNVFDSQEAQNKAVVSSYYENVWNNGDLTQINVLFAETFQDQECLAEQEISRAGFIKVVSAVQEGFEGIHFTVDEMQASGDTVNVNWHFEATFAPSGQHLKIGGIDNWRLQDGQIVQRWGKTDMLALFSQALGLTSSIQLPRYSSGVRPTQEDQAVVRRYYQDVWNQGESALLDNLLAADFVDHNPDPGQAPDLQGFKQSIAGFQKAFRDSHFTTEKMVVEGDKVRVDWRYNGVLSFTGRKVIFKGTEVWALKNGKIQARWGEYDQQGFLNGIGVAK